MQQRFRRSTRRYAAANPHSPEETSGERPRKSPKYKKSHILGLKIVI